MGWLTAIAHLAAPRRWHKPSFLKVMKMAKRELIDTGTDKRYIRRDEKGQFKESTDVGKSLAQDVRKKAKTKVKEGEGDRSDRAR
jgi:hypothetical protein